MRSIPVKVRIQKRTWQWLKRRAVQERKSMAQLAREAVREVYRLPESKTIPS